MTEECSEGCTLCKHVEQTMMQIAYYYAKKVPYEVVEEKMLVEKNPS